MPESLEAPQCLLGVVYSIRKFLTGIKRSVEIKRYCTIVLLLESRVAGGAMGPIRVFVSLLALTFSAFSPAVGMTGDGRVQLNIGFLTSKTGRFSSEGK